MILLILPVLSSISVWFSEPSPYCPSTWFLSLRLVMIRDSHIVDFPFPFSLCFVHFFIYENDYLSSDMLQRKHIQVVRPQTSHSLPSVPLFFLFFFLFLFSLFFFLFSSSFTFFCPTGEKKRSFFFFLSCSCSGPKPGRSGEQWQTCRRQPGPSAFCLYLSKGFWFCSSIHFSLTVLKSKNDSPSTWPLLQSDSSAFFSTSFFLGCSSLDFWIFCPSAVETGSLSTLGGMWYCRFFILWLRVRFFCNSSFVFFLGFCDTTLLIP